MKKSKVCSFGLIFLAFLFSFGLASAVTNVTVTEISSTQVQVDIVDAVDLYGFEVNFDYTGTIDGYDDAGFLGAEAAGVAYNEKSGIVSFYDSRLDNTKTGISGSGNLFNVTFTGTLTLRSALFVNTTSDEDTVSFASTYCGDQTCDVDETCSSCAGDCGACASSGSTGGGGGGGTIQVIQTYSINEAEVEKGYVQSLGRGEKVQFIINKQEHLLSVLSVDSQTAEYQVESEPIKFILRVGESKKIDLNSDGVYDIKVSLENIANNRASTTISKISEGASAAEKISDIAKQATDGVKSAINKIITVSDITWPIVSAIVLTIILVIVILLFVAPRFRKKKKSKR